MHHLTILLVKADDKQSARDKAAEFLEPHGDGKVWDWYQFGGRWSGVLDPKRDEFYEWASAQPKDENGGDFFTCQNINKNKEMLQSKWEEMGGHGVNPLTRNGGIPSMGEQDDDVAPLADCVETVKKHLINREERLEELAKEFNDPEKKSYRSVFAEEYANLDYDRFYFESAVYDAEQETNSFPDDISGYWAVVVDKHN